MLQELPAFPFLWLLDSAQPVPIRAGLICGVGLAAPMMFAASGSFLSQQFPPEVRAGGLGTREIAGAVSGGLAPVAAPGLVTASATNATWGVSVMFVVAALSVIGGSLFDQHRAVARRSASTHVSEPVALDR